MKIRLYNARILTMKEGEEIFQGEIWTDGAYLTYVGSSREDTPKDFQREIDCKGDLLMPGFKNAHTHSAMTLMRSLADDCPLDKWLHTQIFPLEAKLTPEDIYTATELAILEYLTTGVTAIFDMYLTPDSIADACTNMGMRCVQVGGLNNFSQSIPLLEQWYERLNHKDEWNSFMLGFHAEYTTSKELLAQVAELAHKYKAPVFTHISETKAEVEGCVERYGCTPVQLLDSLGMWEYGGGGYHGVYLTPEDRAIFKKHHLTIVTNPGSNTKLASGIAPISDFLKDGIPVAIGTDGPSSNNCLDMFREMFLVTGLAKLKEQDAAAVDAGEVLKMATVNGAKAMGLHDSDVLAEKKHADLIRIDLRQPNMQPIHNIQKNLVYSGSKQNVLMTMIHGKILYEDGIFYTKDQPEAIYRGVEKTLERILEK